MRKAVLSLCLLSLSLLVFGMISGNCQGPEPYRGGPSPIPSNAPDRAVRALQRVRPLLEPRLADLGLGWGDPVFLRFFKESAEMELWMQAEPGQAYTLVRLYQVASMSGALGPKLAEGDGQTPEGFYAVGLGALNPRSRYHLSFDIGYPNAYDRAQSRTGSFIMVHGARVSIGCYAMTDESIEQIYSLVAAALERGQSVVPVHCFPFRMTEERMAQAVGSPWYSFWTELRVGYLRFESPKRPPEIEVFGNQYHIR